ncbi:MAG: hypothetical protein FJX86_02135 [Bacteroidetes bacterium]|nr:hypothetical protein [Bacteroidota bacterium]MBM3914060.1 hypothetical protein [Sphingomonadales bacterium]
MQPGNANRIQSIHNLKALFWFRALAFLIVGAGAAPMFFVKSDSVYVYGALLGSFVLIILLWAVIKPSYTAVESDGQRILISTDKDDSGKFYLELPASQMVSFELWPVSGGLLWVLVILRQTPQGVMRSKRIHLSLYGASKVKGVRTLLNNILIENQRQPIIV